MEAPRTDESRPHGADGSRTLSWVRLGSVHGSRIRALGVQLRAHPLPSVDRQRLKIGDGADDGPDQRAHAALLAVLDAAPSEGLSADELAARIGMGRTWVFTRLHIHEMAGRAAKLRRGRWAGGGTR